MAAMASPVLCPGRLTDDLHGGDTVVALKTGEPKLHLVLAKAEKGTIWPALLRTYHSFRSSGFIRKGHPPADRPS